MLKNGFVGSEPYQMCDFRRVTQVLQSLSFVICEMG